LSDQRFGEKVCIEAEVAPPMMSLIKRKVMAATKTKRDYTSGWFILVLFSEALCD
jgi:hypothetical protein